MACGTRALADETDASVSATQTSPAVHGGAPFNRQLPSTGNAYEPLREAIRGRSLPLAVVDLDAFDHNVRQFAEEVARHGKTMRIASKSLRVPALLQRALTIGGAALRGLMCFSTAEARYLAEQGFDDLLVAYPAVQRSDVVQAAAISRAGKSVTLMVDCESVARQLNSWWREERIDQPLRVCIDVDVAWRPGGQHIGAQRSPIRSRRDLERVVHCVRGQSDLQLVGVMAYEAHLAGLPDANPFTPWKNYGVRAMQWLARRDVVRQRGAIRSLFEQQQWPLPIFNGGGTGSFASAVAEPWLTEVTVGSGLLQPHLFDYYRGVSRPPALYFALPVTRLPQADRATCQSGGFIASGPPAVDRQPRPWFPPGLRIDAREGYGEVQTPLIVPPEMQGRLAIGDPVFFRPAKSGELAERFDEYCLCQGGAMVGEVKTYRGLGLTFW